MKRAILCVTLLWATGAAASEPHAELSVLFPKNVSRAVVFAAASVKDAPRVEWQVGELLRHSGRVEVIVPSAALGTPAGSAEEAVTKRAFNMPIDAVVLVRGADAPMLVAVYRNGTRRGPTALELPPPAKEPKNEAPVASAATPAPAVASPKPTTETAAAPAPASPAPTPEPTAAPAPTPPPAEHRSPEQAQAYYDASYIGFREFPSVRKTEPYEGRYQRLLQWPEFYQKVGRPDLVDRAHTRRAWQRGLIATGVIVTVGGLVGFIAQAAVNSCSSVTDCHLGVEGNDAGYVLTGAGLGLILGGSFVTTKVEPAWEARRMGEGYNAWLKQQLGIAK